MSKQLNIFVENKPGRIDSIAESLCKSNIDIRAFAIQDRGDYGLLKLIVDKPEQAYLALADLGCACALKDKPGNFHKLTSALAQNNVNVADAYGFVLQPHKTGVCCIELERQQLAMAEKIATEAGFSILGDEELYNM